jgi:hypothetical protein
LLSNKPDVLKRVIDLRAQPDGPSLASLPTYRAARGAANPDAAAVLVANMGVIQQHPPVREALAKGGNPMAALLFAGVTESLRGSQWLTLSLRVAGNELTVDATVDHPLADKSDVAAFALPRQSGEGAMPLLTVPGSIAGLSLYRDLHAFYSAKDELFPERTSGLIFFENMMGIFFSGRDLTDEVLAETTPDVRFVVAQQQYDPAVGTPGVQIPSFAAILRIRDPEKFREVAEEAWQKALGLVNFTRGQQGLPGLIIDRVTHRDTTFTAAHFSSASVKDRTALDTHFNFCPSLAMLDDYLILSSTDGLARQLIDAVQDQQAKTAKPSAVVHSLVRVDGAELASILRANRENLVRQNMIEEGNSQEQAETEIDILLSVIQYLGRLDLSVGHQQGQPHAQLQVKLNLP